ncbi:hypothetical protein QTN25_005014 [Entamoeba marina]
MFAYILFILFISAHAGVVDKAKKIAKGAVVKTTSNGGSARIGDLKKTVKVVDNNKLKVNVTGSKNNDVRSLKGNVSYKPNDKFSASGDATFENSKNGKSIDANGKVAYNPNDNLKLNGDVHYSKDNSGKSFKANGQANYDNGKTQANLQAKYELDKNANGKKVVVGGKGNLKTSNLNADAQAVYTNAYGDKSLTANGNLKYKVNDKLSLTANGDYSKTSSGKTSNLKLGGNYQNGDWNVKGAYLYNNNNGVNKNALGVSATNDNGFYARAGAEKVSGQDLKYKAGLGYSKDFNTKYGTFTPTVDAGVSTNGKFGYETSAGLQYKAKNGMTVTGNVGYNGEPSAGLKIGYSF